MQKKPYSNAPTASASAAADLADIKSRLAALLARVQKLRGQLYPANWTYDPLYMVEKELEALLQELA